MMPVVMTVVTGNGDPHDVKNDFASAMLSGGGRAGLKQQ